MNNFELVVLIGILGFVFILIKSEISDSKESREATKTCKCCGNKVAYNASVCEFCGRNPGNGGMLVNGRLTLNSLGRMIKYMLIFAVFFFVICFIFGVL